jgi:hypothetical protein
MGFFELETPEGMLEKAKRELARFEADVSVDHVYNFFVTAYHITDYLDAGLKKQVQKNPLIRLCGDACDKAQHMKLTPGRPDVKMPKYYKATVSASLSALSPSVEWWIVWPDGSSREVVSFARDVIAKWETLFAEHGIGP